jgi:hypothetical protein
MLTDRQASACMKAMGGADKGDYDPALLRAVNDALVRQRTQSDLIEQEKSGQDARKA